MITSHINASGGFDRLNKAILSFRTGFYQNDLAEDDKIHLESACCRHTWDTKLCINLRVLELVPSDGELQLEKMQWVMDAYRRDLPPCPTND